jgi:hypothetical protein
MEVLLSSLIMMRHVSAQVGPMFDVPFYFGVTANAPSTIAGAHLALTLGATGVAFLTCLLLILR